MYDNRAESGLLAVNIEAVYWIALTNCSLK